ncbi:MAG TPA: phosphate ABC transporter substrate-binding protein PstS [Phototrophicaceae bacterium]|nr:phosphate ABC transporter substrate-binding protein PstS [Phototrophicaceae bacterium]
MKKQALVAIGAVMLLSVGLAFAQDATPEMTPAMTAIPGSGMITGPADGEAQALTGAGSTFAQPLYTSWFADYAKLTNVQVNYQGVGSGAGIKAVTDQTVDFGATDAPMTDQQLSDAQAKCNADMLHIATAIGGVAITYNIPELQSSSTVLKFTPDTLVGIFDGSINTWNDAKLVADNPDLKDIAQPIAVVHRSDSSGTSNILTSYFAAVNSDWKTNVGAGTAVSWPTGIGQKGSAGVAGAIAGVPYAVGYVETTYATQNNLPVAEVENKANNFVAPTVENVSAAAAGFTLPADLRIMIVNGDGDNTYPITGFTWALVCPNQTDAGKALALARVFWWGVHDGQSYNTQLGYAPLPAPAVAADEALILKINVGGKQALPTDIATPAAS